MSTFDYCPAVWMFCGKANSDRLEKLNERALRIVYNDYVSSYDCLLEKSNVLSLSMLRLKYMIIEVYRCVNRLNPEYMNNMFTIKDTNYSMRDGSIVVQPKFNNTTFGYRSFSYYGAKLWNAIPSDLKTIKPENFSKFKKDLHGWLFTAKPKHLDVYFRT